MVQSDADELVEDAEIDGLSRGGGFGKFLKGLLLGILTSGAVLVGLSLSHPLPQGLPGIGNVRIEGQAPTEPSDEAVSAQPTDDRETPAQASTSEDSADGSGETQVAASDVVSSTAPEVQQPETSDASASVSEGTAGTAEPADADSLVSDQTAAVQLQPSETTQREPTPTESQAAPEPQAAPDAEQKPEAETTADATDQQIAAISPTDPVTPESSAPEVPELTLSGPAIEVNSRDFEAPPNAPLLAIVLEDAGNGALEADALALMTMPLTLAIRPEGPASAALAQAARLAKHEVLVQLPFARSDAEQSSGFLHSGQSDTDRADLMQRNLAQLPVAIGVVPPDGATLINDAQVMQSIIDPLKDHGFAFIDLVPGGGSQVEPLARSAGLPYGATSRYVPTGASDEDVFNNLETAAFQARQRGSAIVQINASRAALTAILRWGLEKDRRPVWFAPVSAVLKRQAAAQ